MTVNNADALRQFFDNVEKGYWPSNGFNYGHNLPRVTNEDGEDLVLKPDTKAEWTNNVCHGCGVLDLQEEGCDIQTTTHHLCILVERRLPPGDNPRVCSAEFALCGKCQMRAALVTQNSDHLVAGYDWSDMAARLYDMLSCSIWEMSVEQRKAIGMPKGGMPSYFQ